MKASVAGYRATLPRARSAVSTPWAWALVGLLLGALLAALAFAPARWLAGALRQASQDQVLLEDTRGTLWDGSARLTLTGGAGSPAAATLPGRLSWRVRPSLDGLAAQLQSDCCMTQPWRWQLSPRLSGVQVVLSDAQSRWPAALLSGLGTPWNTIQAQGQLVLSTQALRLTWVAGRLQVAGGAQLDALDLSSRLSTLRPMGSYRFAINGGATPELVLSTLTGSLQLSGRGQWVGSRLRFVGEASAEPASQDALSNLLNIIGRREGARSIIKVG